MIWAILIILFVWASAATLFALYYRNTLTCIEKDSRNKDNIIFNLNKDNEALKQELDYYTKPNPKDY